IRDRNVTGVQTCALPISSWLRDHPVPKAVSRGIQRVNLKPLAQALEQMPVRVKGGDARASERVTAARRVLRDVEEELWRTLLAQIGRASCRERVGVWGGG